MNDILKLQRKIIPEMTEILEKRYNIIRVIYHKQPIGRRAVASKLGLGERVVRTEVNILKKQGLLDIKSIGMSLTREGEQIIHQLKDFIHELKGLKSMEEMLEKKLDIKDVVIIPGDCCENELVFKDIGRIASSYIREFIDDNQVVGVTGGTTMAQVAKEMTLSRQSRDVLVLPARGGVGKNVETQANNIAAKLADKLGGTYKLLHMPDNINKEALETMLKLPEIKELVDKIKEMDILVFGIGRADEMAKRRKLSQNSFDSLMNKRAVSEAFGYYFDLVL